MAFLPNTDDADVNEGGLRQPIPEGVYQVVMTNSIQKESSKGDPMLEFVLEVIEGEYEGRKIYDRLMIDHATSEDARAIGRRKIQQLKLAVGKPNAREEQELWDLPVLAEVSIERGKNGNRDKNRLEAFRPIAGSAASVVTATASVHTESAATGKRAWRK